MLDLPEGNQSIFGETIESKIENVKILSQITTYEVDDLLYTLPSHYINIFLKFNKIQNIIEYSLNL